jgi:hypothetical protein
MIFKTDLIVNFTVPVHDKNRACNILKIPVQKPSSGTIFETVPALYRTSVQAPI